MTAGDSRRARPPAGVVEQQEAAPPAEELIWGVNTVGEALRHHPEGISELFVQQGKGGPRIQEIIDLARAAQINLRFVAGERLPVPRSCRHQGVAARQSATPLLTLEAMLDGLRDLPPGRQPRILALDCIQDPRNLGSILRSALAAGFSDIIMTRDRSVPITGTVARTAAGALAQLRICQVVNLAETLRVLQEHGFWTFGAVVEPEAASLYAVDYTGPVCLVIGGEGKGIRPLVKKRCDHLITIPMNAPFNSLNASVAAAIIMFEMARRSS